MELHKDEDPVRYVESFRFLDDKRRARTREYAKALDEQDPLNRVRDEFYIPTKADLRRKTLSSDGIFPLVDVSNIFFQIFRGLQFVSLMNFRCSGHNQFLSVSFRVHDT